MSFFTIPAIDIKDGKCIRLSQGLLSDTEVFNNDPLDQAKYFASFGFKRLHIVDIDGAFEGKPVNFNIISKIKAQTNITIECGGGVRSKENVKTLFDSGIDYVVIGTKAIEDRDFALWACNTYKSKIIIGADLKGKMVATQGWLKSSDVTYGELINTYNSLDLEGILVTDIAKDGMLQGPNLELIKDVATLSKNPIIASGGVASLNDIKSLSLIQNVKGVVVGKAFYKNTIIPQDVINNNL
jgi:phosphoribosylformimino-5-aminoimidazole carboxamide ribotide isomerase